VIGKAGYILKELGGLTILAGARFRLCKRECHLSGRNNMEQWNNVTGAA
jgi:hypothetical protein